MIRTAVPDVPPHTASTVVDALDLITRTVLLDVLGHSGRSARPVRLPVARAVTPLLVGLALGGVFVGLLWLAMTWDERR
jgi:hypothetical protein